MLPEKKSCFEDNEIFALVRLHRPLKKLTPSFRALSAFVLLYASIRWQFQGSLRILPPIHSYGLWRTVGVASDLLGCTIWILGLPVDNWLLFASWVLFFMILFMLFVCSGSCPFFGDWYYFTRISFPFSENIWKERTCLRTHTHTYLHSCWILFV